MNRKNLLLIGLLVVAVLAALIVSTSGRSSGLTIKKVYDAPAGFSNAAGFDDNSLVFTNGRTFVQYSYVDGKTTPLSPDTTTPELQGIDSLSVSDNRQYLLFHAPPTLVGGVLDTAVKQRGFNTNADHWWLYSLPSHIFTPLPDEVLLAKLDHDNVDALSTSSVGEQITKYSLSTLQSTANIAISPSTNFLPAHNGYLLQTTDNRLLLTTDGILNKAIASDAQALVLTQDRQSVIAGSTNEKNKQLIVINVTDGSVKTIASNLSSQPAYNNNDGVVFVANGSSRTTLSSYNIATRKLTNWNFDKSHQNLIDATATVNGYFGESVAVISDNTSTSRIIGNDIAAINLPSSSYLKVVTSPRGSASLTFEDQTKRLTVATSSKASPELVAAVYAQLKADGYNPDLISIAYSVNNGFETPAN